MGIILLAGYFDVKTSSEIEIYRKDQQSDREKTEAGTHQALFSNLQRFSFFSSSTISSSAFALVTRHLSFVQMGVFL